MAGRSLTLTALEEIFGICRLPPEHPIPGWAQGGGFVSITRTDEELSIVCPEAAVPDGVVCEKGWRCLRVEGPLDFALTGILASLVSPMARAGISVFAVSTHDTDYLLVRSKDLEEAKTLLRNEGHRLRDPRAT
jgi:hypothetical protein